MEVMSHLRLRYDRTQTRRQQAKNAMLEAKADYDAAKADYDAAEAEFKAVKDELDADLWLAAATRATGQAPKVTALKAQQVPVPTPKNKSPVVPAPSYQEVLDLIVSKFPIIRPQDVRNELGISDAAAAARLRKMVPMGLIEKVKRGHYRLPQSVMPKSVMPKSVLGQSTAPLALVTTTPPTSDGGQNKAQN